MLRVLFTHFPILIRKLAQLSGISQTIMLWKILNGVFQKGLRELGAMVLRIFYASLHLRQRVFYLFDTTIVSVLKYANIIFPSIC